MSQSKLVQRKHLLTSMYKNDFIAFVSLAYKIIHPGKELQKNWHIEVIADALHGCLRDEHNRLAIHAPPRSLKSFIASIAFPAFALGRDPTLKIMSIVATQELAGDFCQKLAKLFSSDLYRTLFPHIRYERRREAIRLDHGGSFISSPFFKSPVGRGADILIVDDPVSPGDAKNDQFNAKAAEWFSAEIAPRLNDKTSSIAVLVMQRLAKTDLCSAFFRGDPRKTLVFTAVSRREERWELPDGTTYIRPPRTPLNAKRETLEQLWKIYQSMKFGDFALQYLQDPYADRYIGGPVYYPFDTTDWTPGKGGPERCFLFKNSWYVQYECFGVGDPPPYLAQNPLTDEQEDERIAWAQAKLLREMQQDIEDV